MITNFASFVNVAIAAIINPVIAIIFSLAIVYFFAGVVKYIGQGGDKKAREDGRNMMIYGIIALFVMVSVWGLVQLVKETFPLNNTPPTLPTS